MNPFDELTHWNDRVCFQSIEWPFRCMQLWFTWKMWKFLIQIPDTISSIFLEIFFIENILYTLSVNGVNKIAFFTDIFAKFQYFNSKYS